jgi:hypothetical protein
MEGTLMPSEAHPDDADTPMAAKYARLFTPREADKLVPYLEQMFGEIGTWRVALGEALTGLEKYGIELDKPLPEELAHDPEVTAVVDGALAAHKGLRDALIALEDLGVEVKALDGLVDVPSRFEGRIVFLCWKRGDPRFGHWHETDQGYAARIAIANRRAFEGSFLH